MAPPGCALTLISSFWSYKINFFFHLLDHGEHFSTEWQKITLTNVQTYYRPLTIRKITSFRSGCLLLLRKSEIVKKIQQKAVTHHSIFSSIPLEEIFFSVPKTPLWGLEQTLFCKMIIQNNPCIWNLEIAGAIFWLSRSLSDVTCTIPAIFLFNVL